MTAVQLDLLDLLADLAPLALTGRSAEVMGHLCSDQTAMEFTPPAAVVAGWRPRSNRNAIRGRQSGQIGGGQIRWRFVTFPECPECPDCAECDPLLYVDAPWSTTPVAMEVGYHRLGMQGRTFKVADDPWCLFTVDMGGMIAWAESLPADILAAAAQIAARAQHGNLRSREWRDLGRITADAIGATPIVTVAEPIGVAS